MKFTQKQRETIVEMALDSTRTNAYDTLKYDISARTDENFRNLLDSFDSGLEYAFDCISFLSGVDYSEFSDSCYADIKLREMWAMSVKSSWYPF